MATALTSDDFSVFFAAHYGDILRVVTLVTGSRPAAEDVVHEALARAWERGGEIEQLNRWVLTVALNLARNRWRKLRRETLRPDVGLDRRAAPADAAPADPVSVDLRRALSGLPTRQREVVVLHYLLDLPVAEVADLLGLSPGGVKHALFRARQSLSTVLAIEEVP